MIDHKRDGQGRVLRMLSEHEDMRKAEGLRRMNQICKVALLNDRNTHFSNINHAEPVWWFHIPLTKIAGSNAEAFLHVVCYDRRSYKLTHLNVPTSYLRKHLNNPQKLRQFTHVSQVIKISIELSIKMVDLFQDRLSGCDFAQFKCCDVACEHS
jgi:hypothetical protein